MALLATTTLICSVAAAALFSAVSPAPVADAQPSNGVLILASSVNGGASSPEALAAEADGYSVTVDNASTWDSLSESSFAGFQAIILGDPSTSSSCASNPSVSLAAATSDQSTWSSAVTGNVLVAGAAPSFAAEATTNSSGATAFLEAAIRYAASGSGGTGLYVSLDCYYATASSGTSVPILSDVGGGGFAVQGQGGGTCDNSGTLDAPVRDAADISDLDDTDVAAWPCSVEEGFTAYPSSYSVLAIDRAVSSGFTTPDGMSGQPYAVVSTLGASGLSSAPGGDLAASATFGLSDAGGPGISSSTVSVADGVDPATGDFSESYDDLSIPSYGPPLDFTRTYDAKLAQQEALTASPGPFGDGWSDSFAAHLALHQNAPGDLYTLDGNLTDNGDGGGSTGAPLYDPQNEYVDSSGNVYVADWGDNRIQEIAGANGSQWGISMTTGDAYTIVGSPTGTGGDSANGTPIAQSLLSAPTGVTVLNGNLYIADTDNNRVVEVPSTSGGGMTADELYTIIGSQSGQSGDSGNGTAGTSAKISYPTDVKAQGNNLYVDDSGNNRVIELPASGGTQWGISMTANDIYDVAGGKAGDSTNGTKATSAGLCDPEGIAVSSGPYLYIADTCNNRVVFVSSSSGTHWGQSMTADDIYTIAGAQNGSEGSSGDGGVGTSAYLSSPTALQMGTQLYIADSGNNRVQELAASSHSEWGISMTADDIYTVAGSSHGAGGYRGDGGLATSALLNSPSGLRTDASGDLYISDSGNDRVRLVNASTYDVSTFAGTGGPLSTDGDFGPATGAGLSAPGAVAVDASGNVYVADSGNDRIQEIAATNHTQFGISMAAGDVYTVAGLADGTPGTSTNNIQATTANLDFPEGVAVDAAGDLYLSDTDSDRIRIVPAASGSYWGVSMTAGYIYTILGTANDCGSSGNGGGASSALACAPGGLSLDPSGDVVFADMANNEVRVIAASSHTQWGVSMTKGDVYDVAGSTNGTAGLSGDGGPATSAYLDFPADAAVASNGDLYIADSWNNRVQEVAAASETERGQTLTLGDVYTVAGSASGTAGTSGDGGPATSALLDDPWAVTVDASGDLYVADKLNDRVQEAPASTGSQWGTLMSPVDSPMTAGDIYTIAGSASGTAGYGGDGATANASGSELNEPDGLALGPSGDLYLADSVNNRLREVSAGSVPVLPTWPAGQGLSVQESSGATDTFYPVEGSCSSPYHSAGSGYCALSDVLAQLSYNSGPETYSLLLPSQETLTFNQQGQLTAESDQAGDTLSIAVGSPAPDSGQCPSTATSCDTVTSASGRALTIALNASGEVASVTDPMGRTWSYGYNTSGDLTSATDPMSRVTSYTYDTANPDPLLVHDLLTVTKPNGQSGGPDAGTKTTNAYDADGRVLSQTDPMGWETTFNYSGLDAATGDGQVVVTDPDGNETAYEFASGVETAQYVGFDPPPNSPPPSDTLYAPDPATLLTDATADPDGDITADTYSAFGDVTSQTSPQTAESTSTTTTSYTSEPYAADCTAAALATSPCSSLSPPAPVAAGETISPPSSSPPLGTTYTQVDSLGNDLWSTTGVYEPGASSASYQQTSYELYPGNTVTLAGNQISCNATPPSNSLPCATIDADGTVTQLGYDSDGDLVSSSTADGNRTQLATTTYSYDADGEQTATTSPDGNVSGANAANYTTTTAYDADGEVTSSTEAGGSGASVTPRTTSYGYCDDVGATVSAPGLTHTATGLRAFASICRPGVVTAVTA